MNQNINLISNHQSFATWYLNKYLPEKKEEFLSLLPPENDIKTYFLSQKLQENIIKSVHDFISSHVDIKNSEAVDDLFYTFLSDFQNREKYVRNFELFLHKNMNDFDIFLAFVHLRYEMLISGLKSLKDEEKIFMSSKMVRSLASFGPLEFLTQVPCKICGKIYDKNMFKYNTENMIGHKILSDLCAVCKNINRGNYFKLRDMIWSRILEDMEFDNKDVFLKYRQNIVEQIISESNLSELELYIINQI